MAIRFEDKNGDDQEPAAKPATKAVTKPAPGPAAPPPADDAAEPEPQLPFGKAPRPEKRKKR